MKPVCHCILRKMEGRDSRIHWCREGADNMSFQSVNDQLVSLFRKMLRTVTDLTSQPEAAWSRAQLECALNEIQTALD